MVQKVHRTRYRNRLELLRGPHWNGVRSNDRSVRRLAVGELVDRQNVRRCCIETGTGVEPIIRGRPHVYYMGVSFLFLKGENHE